MPSSCEKHYHFRFSDQSARLWLIWNTKTIQICPIPVLHWQICTAQISIFVIPFHGSQQLYIFESPSIMNGTISFFKHSLKQISLPIQSFSSWKVWIRSKYHENKKCHQMQSWPFYCTIAIIFASVWSHLPAGSFPFRTSTHTSLAGHDKKQTYSQYTKILFLLTRPSRDVTACLEM